MDDSKYHLENKKITIIGCDDDLSDYLEKSLSCAGVTVEVYTTTHNEYDAIRTANPDFFIIGTLLTFDEISEFIDQLRGREETKDTMVIIVTEIDSVRDICKENCKVVKQNDMGSVDIFKAIEETIRPQTNKTSKAIDINEKSKVALSGDPVNGIKVLIFEDDPLLGDLLATKLVKSDIPYKLSHQGARAVDLIKEYRPTIVILDISLPDSNGLSALEDIRRSEEIKNVPVVIFSNKDNQTDRKRAEELGVKKFLVKVMTDLNDLVNIIKETRP